jgi:hypothetical protein
MENDFFLSVDRGVIAIAIVTGLVLTINQLARLRRTTMLHRTISQAIGANSPLAPSLIEKLDAKPSYTDDSRTGLVLLAVAVGLVLFGLVEGASGTVRSFIAVAMLPASVGAALFGRGWLGSREGSPN